MEWIAGTWFILLIGGMPTVLSITLGIYWLKHERFPWEARNITSVKLKKDNRNEAVQSHPERGGGIG